MDWNQRNGSSMQEVKKVKNVLSNLFTLEQEFNNDVTGLRRNQAFNEIESKGVENAAVFQRIFQFLGFLGEASIMIPNRESAATDIQDAKPFVLDYYKRAFEGLMEYIETLLYFAKEESLSAMSQQLVDKAERAIAYKEEYAKTLDDVLAKLEKSAEAEDLENTEAE